MSDIVDFVAQGDTDLRPALERACAEVERLRATNAELVAALKPFANSVYNDNGDMTVTPCGIDDYIKAYFVMRRLAKAGGKE